jgi:hypothetical protein
MRARDENGKETVEKREYVSAQLQGSLCVFAFLSLQIPRALFLHHPVFAPQ